MTTSDNGIKLIASFEGLRLKAYKLTGEKYFTIGYGHSYDSNITADTVITKEQALSYLKTDLAKFENYVNKYVTNIALNQNQFDSLVSYTYNRGAGGLKQLVSNSNTAEEYANNIVIYWGSAITYKNSLIARRKKEQELFLTPVIDENKEGDSLKYNVLEKVTKEFLKWVGYCEKTSASSIGADYDNPESYTKNAGDNNYTIFAKVYKEKTGINIQGQPWCDCFIDTIFIHLFGMDMAKKLLGGFSGYTPTSAQYFKNIGRWTTGEPQEGYIGFFKNSERIYHTFYVKESKDGKMITIEGNTGGLTGVVENGGCVAQKTYDYNAYKSRIAGFGMPDYSLVEEYKEGWLKAADGVRWWYQYADGIYPANKWLLLNHHWYLFDKNGYMCTGWHRWNGNDCDPEDGSGQWYFLDNTPSGDYEGACWHEVKEKTGALELWYVE